MTANFNDDRDDAQRAASHSTEIVPATTPVRVLSVPRVTREATIQPAGDTQEIDFSRYLHSLRRNWLLGITLGIILGTPMAIGVWTLLPQEYEASEFIRISPTHTRLVFDTPETTTRNDFKNLKSTQKQLLLQPLALNKAIQDPEVAKLPAVRENPDPIGWLTKSLKVTFPDEAEIMSVSLKMNNAAAAHRIVKAIVDTYMIDVVEKEKAERRDRIERLQKILKEAEEKVRRKHGALSELVDLLGTSDSGTLNLAQQSSIQQFSLLRAELSKVTFELMRAKGELAARSVTQNSDAKDPAVKNATPAEASTTTKREADDNSGAASAANQGDSSNVVVSSPDETAPSNPPAPRDVRLEEALDMDPTASKLTKDVERFQKLIKQTGQRYDAATAASYLEKYQVQLEEAQQKLAERTKRIERLILESTGPSGLSKSDNLPLKIDVLEKQQTQLRDEMKVLENEAKKYGRSSTDVEMMRKEINGLDPVVSRLSQEIEQAKIEIQSTSRITLYPTTGVPTVGANKHRIPLAAASGLFGLLLPLAFFVLRDSSRRHVSSIATISNDVRIPVLGSVPRVPPRVMRRLNDASKSSSLYWRSRVSESMSAITAMLLRRLAMDGHRLILVTSAVPGEGKSTLSEHLAMSLADSGHKTLLIDFDLRRPQLHRRMTTPLSPGVSNVLRQGAELKQAIRETNSPNLFLLTAGNCHGSLLLEAANGSLDILFKECRDEFELVIVDSSPLIPVVDGRLIGQFMDGAILTVVKDTSQIPQVMLARQMMEDYGIEVLGCVFAGDNSDAYHDLYGRSAETENALTKGIVASRSMSAM